jgi:hypothetical protein
LDSGHSFVRRTIAVVIGGRGIDDAHAPSAELVEIVLTCNPLESRVLVNDLDEQPLPINACPERDHARPVHHRIGDDFTEGSRGPGSRAWVRGSSTSTGPCINTFFPRNPPANVAGGRFRSRRWKSSPFRSRPPGREPSSSVRFVGSRVTDRRTTWFDGRSAAGGLGAGVVGTSDGPSREAVRRRGRMGRKSATVPVTEATLVGPHATARGVRGGCVQVRRSRSAWSASRAASASASI